MTDRPLILLDVDGALNACHRQPWTVSDGWPEPAWRVVAVPQWSGEAWPVRAADPVADALRRWHSRAEIRWHTTWQWDAPRVGAALGLPEWPVESAPEFQRIGEFLLANRWWKWPAVLRALLTGRPVAWLDDDIDVDTTAQQRAFLRAAGCLAVHPPTATGLTQRHLDAVDEWLNQHNERD